MSPRCCAARARPVLISSPTVRKDRGAKTNRSAAGDQTDLHSRKPDLCVPKYQHPLTLPSPEGRGLNTAPRIRRRAHIPENELLPASSGRHAASTNALLLSSYCENSVSRQSGDAGSGLAGAARRPSRHRARPSLRRAARSAAPAARPSLPRAPCFQKASSISSGACLRRLSRWPRSEPRWIPQRIGTGCFVATISRCFES